LIDKGFLSVGSIMQYDRAALQSVPAVIFRDLPEDSFSTRKSRLNIGNAGPGGQGLRLHQGAADAFG
jgi:hypothetical protein